MRKPEPLAPTGGQPLFPDEMWLKKLPTICEYLSHTTYEDGSPRETSTISVKEQDGKVLVALNDKQESRGLYRSAGSVQEAMALIEKALATNSADWRVWKQEGKGKGVKKG